MKPFIYDTWHAWRGTAAVMLSDEATKTLREFKTADEAITWLYLSGFKEAARALNQHFKSRHTVADL